MAAPGLHDPIPVLVLALDGKAGGINVLPLIARTKAVA